MAREDGERTESLASWFQMALSCLLTTVSVGTVFLIVVLLEPASRDLEISRTTFSISYFLIWVGAGIGGSFIFPVFSGRVHIRYRSVVAAISLATGTYIISISESMWVILPSHFFLVGLLGLGGFFAPLLSNIQSWFSKNVGLAVGVVSAGQLLSGVVWTPIFDSWQDAQDWRGVYFNYAVVSGVLLFLGALLLRSRTSPMAPGSTSVQKKIAFLDGLTVSAFLCFLGVGGVVLHLYTALSDGNLEPSKVVMITSALFTFAIASRFAVGPLSDRIGARAVLITSLCGQTIGCALFLAMDVGLIVWIAAGIFGLAYGGGLPLFSLVAREGTDARYGERRFGRVIMSGTIGMALGGVLGAKLFDIFGGYTEFFIAGTLASGTAALFVILSGKG